MAVFEKCKDIPLDVEREAFYLNEGWNNGEEWCKDKIAPEGRCFRGTIPDQTDNNCKCKNHKCHNNINKNEL